MNRDPSVPSDARFTIRSPIAQDPKDFYLREEPVKEPGRSPYWVADCCRHGQSAYAPGLFTEEEVATLRPL